LLALGLELLQVLAQNELQLEQVLPIGEQQVRVLDRGRVLVQVHTLVPALGLPDGVAQPQLEPGLVGRPGLQGEVQAA